MRRILLLPILLLFALHALGVLNLTIMETCAAVSPYIGVVPPSTVNQALAPGMNYTISIYTDYDGSDIWGYEFKLTFNPNVLNGTEVVNGNLITEADGTTMWKPGTFNNTEGKLSLTLNAFFAIGLPKPVTSGPGTLANVTFRVVGKGTSNITLEIDPEDPDRTKLIGYTEGGNGERYNIIDPKTMPDQIQHGFFDNRFPHDVAVVSVTANAEAAVRSLVYVDVEVLNIGKSAEEANVTIFHNSNYIDSKNVTVLVVENKTASLSWDTTGLAQGLYTLNATVTISGDGDLGDNWNTTTFSVAHDVAVVSVTAPAKVTVGSVVSISVEVANEGSFTEMTNVTILYDSILIGFNDTVIVPAQSNVTVPFEWETTGLAEDTYVLNATATIPNDGDPSNNWNTTSIFLSGHDVVVVNVTAPAKAAVGSSVSVSVEVLNIGIFAEEANVTILYDSNYIDSQNVTLLVGEKKTALFSWDTTGLAEDVYALNATASISGDGDLGDNWNTTIILLLEHDVAVESILLTSTTAAPGDVVSINVTVSNIGAFLEVANVTILYDSILIGFNDTVVIPAQSSVIVPFEWNTAGLAQGNYTLNATATISGDGDLGDNWKTTTILLAMHDLAVTYISVLPITIYVGDLATISVQVRNNGWFNEMFEVEVTYDGITIEETKTATLSSGNANYTRFSWNTTGVAPDSYTITAKAILATDQDTNNNLLNRSVVVKPLPPGAIAGTVMDASTGDPIVGASVTANGNTATTNANGHYNITEVPIGALNVTAEATGYSSDFKLVTVESEKTTLVNFTLQGISALVHDLAVIDITLNPTTAEVGRNVTITVVVENQGTETETFNVEVYYDATEIGTQEVTDLVPDVQKTLTFSWDTTDIDVGDYTIKAVASTVTGETDTTDNTEIYGTFTLSSPSPAVPPIEVIIAAVAVIAIVALGSYAILKKRRKPSKNT